MQENIFTEILLLVLGMIIMLVAIILYFKLYKSMSKLKEHIDSLTKVMFRLYIVLMIFFLIAYGYVIYNILTSADVNNQFLISFVFFFGSIFVIIGIIVQLRLTDCIHKNNMQIVKTLVGASEARDLNLKGHSVHVVCLSLLIYDHLPSRLSFQINRENLEYASVLHDIGKLGIPEHVLNKPGKLTDEEWLLMKEHPKIGTKILEGVTGFDEISKYILCHHEKLDATGYYNINDIPLGSKIISVADAYSAIVMRRSYKESMDHSNAIANMSQAVGTQFDKEIFDIFCGIDKELILKCLPKF